MLQLLQIDSDVLGSFCGTATRRITALEACIAKAERARNPGGTGLAIASEGSFRPHPFVPLLPVVLEVMVSLDRRRGLMIHAQLIARRTNFSQRCAPLAAAQTPQLLEDLAAAG